FDRWVHSPVQKSSNNRQATRSPNEHLTPSGLREAFRDHSSYYSDFAVWLRRVPSGTWHRLLRWGQHQPDSAHHPHPSPAKGDLNGSRAKSRTPSLVNRKALRLRPEAVVWFAFQDSRTARRSALDPPVDCLAQKRLRRLPAQQRGG